MAVTTPIILWGSSPFVIVKSFKLKQRKNKLKLANRGRFFHPPSNSSISVLDLQLPLTIQPQ